MPELPEVETVRLQLLHTLKGKKVANVTVYHKKTIQDDPMLPRELPGMTIRHIDRIGKLMIVSFIEDTKSVLLIHLKMTGQCLVWTPEGVSGGGHTMTESDTTLPHVHTRVAISFTDGTTLFFNDLRLFGYLKRVDLPTLERIIETYGPEPIAATFSPNTLAEELQRRKLSIKAALLNQSIVAGLGNIYVDETLFAARVHPLRSTHSLTTKEAREIARLSRTILLAAVEAGGTTFQHFVDTGGSEGNYKDYLKVFGKQGTPCPRCNTTIIKIRVAGRGTHLCPYCQR